MKREIAQFVARCMTCQKVKFDHQKMGGELQSLEVPTGKWDSISMDFVVGLPLTSNGRNQIWVVVDRLTKTARFIPIRDTWGASKLAEVYMKEIVRFHGVPTSIVSDRDAKFLSNFWKSFRRP